MTEKPPMVEFGTLLATQLPTRVNSSTAAIITRPFLTSKFLFFPYVYALTALASTSLASAMPTASYAGIPKNVISIGLMTAAALMPAKPVPKPAPSPARKHTIITLSKYIAAPSFILIIAL